MTTYEESSGSPAADCVTVATRSVLARRRAWALYARSVSGYSARRLLVPLFLLLLLMLPFALARTAPSRGQGNDRARPLFAPTAANHFDRLNLIHTVKDDETLWLICMQYYGKGTLAVQQRLCDANPFLGKNLQDFKPQDFKIGLQLKVPVP